ncbi:amidohydrolase family protein [Jiangella rhizosphaerae]|uniref:Amidohydrolase n=1 Tax=Jiangella rhizosphaerae TaxID=2293569 RepID=A0A418KKQ6_9ACTN|nr:amidohydrolase family protein [Jiangella rhizosphaerae]RIQ17869.1 amidohydrolase [Jiangella rhizosphaerae]
MIDFHTHTPAWRTSSWLGGATFDAADFLAFMDAAGIERAVVLSHDGLFNPSPRANDELAAFVAADPDRLIGFGTVSPRHEDAALEAARMMDELGLRGMKLHPWLQGFSLQERTLDPICEVLVERGGTLLCHDGTPPYSTPAQIAALARRHPRLPVVLGHGGLHDCWREALEACRQTPNLYLCICGTPPYAARHIVEHGPADRILFGTDAGLSDQAEQHYAVARVAEIDGWGISADRRRAMLVDNPRRLLERSAR